MRKIGCSHLQFHNLPRAGGFFGGDAGTDGFAGFFASPLRWERRDLASYSEICGKSRVGSL